MNSTNGKRGLYLFIGLMCLLITACKQKTPEQAKPLEGHEGLKAAHQLDADPHQMGMAPPKTAKQVVVPEGVRDKWPMVSIAVKDKSSGSSVSYEVKPDSELEIPHTSLKLKIGAFLPDFTMDAGQITSQSAEPNNPALQVTIHEAGEEKYSGWLFSKYAEMHAFEHERYSVILEDKFDTKGPTDI